MIELPNKIELVRLADDAIVEADVVEFDKSFARKEIDGKWWQLPDVPRQMREAENDHHWQWWKRVGKLANNRWHEAVAVQTEDGVVEGAILYHINTKSFIHSDDGAVYVEALATAPHNRRRLVNPPLYRGVGEGLLLRAVIHSYLLDFGGRVNLESFDDSDTLSFYENRGFVVVGNQGSLPVLEIDSQAALAWLRNEGYDL